MPLVDDDDDEVNEVPSVHDSMPSLASTGSMSSEEEDVHVCEEQMTGRSLTESELSKLGFFVPGRRARYLEEVSSASSVESSDSDLSLFLAEANRGVVNVEMLGDGEPGIDIPYPVIRFAGQADVMLESDGCSMVLSDVTEDEGPDASDSAMIDAVNIENLVEDFSQLNPPTLNDSI